MHKDIQERRKNGRERQRRYLLAHPERGRQAVKRYAKRHPERIRAKDARESASKLKARRVVNKAIKAGTVVRGNCWCGKIGQAHHEDYAKPLDVMWLCAIHHARKHKLKGEMSMETLKHTSTNAIGRSKQAKINNSITLREGHAAINVKVYSLPNNEGTDAQREMAYELTARNFWDNACYLAHKRGYTGIFCEGRSNGWVVPYHWSKGNGLTRHTYDSSYSQGPDAGYPVYPDVEHDSAARERFRGFQRDVRHLLETVSAEYSANLEAVMAD